MFIWAAQERSDVVGVFSHLSRWPNHGLIRLLEIQAIIIRMEEIFVYFITRNVWNYKDVAYLALNCPWVDQTGYFLYIAFQATFVYVDAYLRK